MPMPPLPPEAFPRHQHRRAQVPAHAQPTNQPCCDLGLDARYFFLASAIAFVLTLVGWFDRDETSVAVKTSSSPFNNISPDIAIAVTGVISFVCFVLGVIAACKPDTPRRTAEHLRFDGRVIVGGTTSDLTQQLLGDTNYTNYTLVHDYPPQQQGANPSTTGTFSGVLVDPDSREAADAMEEAQSDPGPESSVSLANAGNSNAG